MYIFKYMGPRATIIDENFRVTTKIKIMKNQVPEALFFVKKRFQKLPTKMLLIVPDKTGTLIPQRVFETRKFGEKSI